MVSDRGTAQLMASPTWAEQEPQIPQTTTLQRARPEEGTGHPPCVRLGFCTRARGEPHHQGTTQANSRVTLGGLRSPLQLA